MNGLSVRHILYPKTAKKQANSPYLFKIVLDSAKAYKEAVKKGHGKFTGLNFKT